MPDIYDKLEAFDLAQPTGTPDAARLAAYAAPITVDQDVPTSKWLGFFLSNGFLGALKSYVSTTPPSGASAVAIGAAEMVLDIMGSSEVPVVSMSQATVKTEVTACLGAFVTEGAAGRLVSLFGTPFGTTHSAAILAMGQQITTQAALDGWSGVPNLDDLAAARNPTRGAGG